MTKKDLITVERDGKIIGYASGIRKAQKLANQDASERGDKIKWKKVQ